MVVAKQETKISYLAEGTIVTPKGFKAAGVHAGLRFAKKDLGVIVCDVPASCAAVYTQNHFQAAPLKVTQQSIAVEQKLQAVVVNSACANACTGERGLKDAYEMRELCAQQFSIAPHLVAVASTGVIGEFMPMEKIREGMKKLQPGDLPEIRN